MQGWLRQSEMTAGAGLTACTACQTLSCGQMHYKPHAPAGTCFRCIAGSVCVAVAAAACKVYGHAVAEHGAQG